MSAISHPRFSVDPDLYQKSDPVRPECSDRSRVDCEHDVPTEYTPRHRNAWPVLLRIPDSETLDPAQLVSWLRLWGGLGAELFQCFHQGDVHIRADMIALARMQGGWRGAIVADRLEGWMRRIAC